MIPTIHQCYEMMDKYAMPEHIRLHSMVVARIACFLSTGLRKAGVDISIEKTVSGAMLHDIAKISCVHSHEDHCLKGKEICETEGFCEISEIVNEHVMLKHSVNEKDFNEKEIVNYSDKRVLHDNVVSIQERMDDILIRYGPHFTHINFEQLLNKNYAITRLIEKKVFNRLDLLPQDVSESITNISLI